MKRIKISKEDLKLLKTRKGNPRDTNASVVDSLLDGVPAIDFAGDLTTIEDCGDLTSIAVSDKSYIKLVMIRFDAERIKWPKKFGIHKILSFLIRRDRVQEDNRKAEAENNNCDKRDSTATTRHVE